MYGKNVRQSLLATLKEAPELKIARAPTIKGPELKPLTAVLLGQLADRILMELWMRGFAVSGRTPEDVPPMGARETPAAHDAWRHGKERNRRSQTDLTP